jgi:hypothetical protein
MELRFIVVFGWTKRVRKVLGVGVMFAEGELA